MSRWQKIGVVLIGLATLFMICFDTALYRAFFHNPTDVHVTYQQLKSEAIPSSMNQVSILYFTDLEYNPAEGDEAAEKVFERIRALNPDIVLFGGDLFSWNADLSDEVRQRMVGWIQSIPAPLGKFSVFGEQDLADLNHSLIVQDVYHKSQVELLSNSSVLLCNHSTDGIRLGGLNVEADASALMEPFSSGQYTLLFSHYPDNLQNVRQAGLPVSYALCGNSHGTQINWPLFGGYKAYEGSTQINRNYTPAMGFPYYISSGTGCINVQARLNSPVELVFMTLVSQ